MAKSKTSGFSGVYSPSPGNIGRDDSGNMIGPAVPAKLSDALGKKGAPMSPVQASEGTNPHYNPSYGAYSSNCQRCVLAYEARRRGYDVTALPTFNGDMLPIGNDFLRAISNAKTVDVGKSKRAIEKKMREYGAGSRAIIGVRKGRNGHVFISENIGGKIVYVDPQTNKMYSGLSLSKVSGATVTRIDNKRFTEYARHAFTRQKV